MGRVRKSPRCRPLLGSYTPSSAGGVEVTCALNNTMVYRDYYHFVPLRPQLEAASLQRRPQDVAPNVLIFMFDSLSRLQFLRWFPRSRRFLSDRMEAFELGGLNKNGDNTWPNLVQMFSGMEQAEMKRQCAPNPTKDPLDSCPFMWKEFKQAGYRTAMAEDAPGMGSFNYLKRGFLEQPTDYYTRPTSLLSDANIAYKKELNTNLCEGTRNSYFSTFKYALDLGTRLADRPFWGFVCQNVYSHDSFNLPYFLDEPYYKVLETLFSSGALNNTVLITMGDHGLRWGRERETFIGGLEERLPFMSLFFPRWLRRRYPAAFDNLRVNQHRLSTFRDVHRTLLDLLQPDETLGGADTREAAENTSSVSLFHRISPYRRCDHVQVPDHFCTCLRSEKIAASDGRAALAAEAVVRELNVLLRAAPQCTPLRLQRVLTARIAQPLKGDPKKSAPFLRQMTTVQLQTVPGGARLEATVLGNGKELHISGSVSRLDRYGHLAWCVSDHHLEKYCHCGGAKRRSTARPVPATTGAASDAAAATGRAVSATSVPGGARTGSPRGTGALGSESSPTKPPGEQAAETKLQASKAPGSKSPVSEAPGPKSPVSEAPGPKAPASEAPRPKSTASEAPKSTLLTSGAPGSKPPASEAPEPKPPASLASVSEPPAPGSEPSANEAPGSETPATKTSVAKPPANEAPGSRPPAAESPA